MDGKERTTQQSSPSNSEATTAHSRVAFVNRDRCRPKKCSLECARCCLVNKMGKLCVSVGHHSPSTTISEELCIGCRLCTTRCPFRAIEIFTLASPILQQLHQKSEISSCVHQYNANGFRLYQLPTPPRPGSVLGLLGSNGTGKSTALRLLRGKLKPNFGHYRSEEKDASSRLHTTSSEDQCKGDDTAVPSLFEGTEYEEFFTPKMCTSVLKPQYCELILKHTKRTSINDGEPGDTTVGAFLATVDQRKMLDFYAKELDLVNILNRGLDCLGGGELQRFAIAATCLQDVDLYLFDEPTNYLDVQQRLVVAKLLRRLCEADKYVVVADHDVAFLEQVADDVSIFHGHPHGYGLVTPAVAAREGVATFLRGDIGMANKRIQEKAQHTLSSADSSSPLQPLSTPRPASVHTSLFSYPQLEKQLGTFHLSVQSGTFAASEITVLVGENGSGKTTFMRMLAGVLRPDNTTTTPLPSLTVSYKPQQICPRFEGTVRELLETKINKAFTDTIFVAEVMKPLFIEDLFEHSVRTLCGGELQRVGLTLALGKPAQLYLIDEPSTFLDADFRVRVAQVLRRFITKQHQQENDGDNATTESKKRFTDAFVVEHDRWMASYLADKIITFRHINVNKDDNGGSGGEDDTRIRKEAQAPCTPHSYKEDPTASRFVL